MFFFKSIPKPETGVPCNFGYSLRDRDDLYACFFQNQWNIDYRIDELRASPPHAAQQSNDTVQKVEFNNCKLTRVPKGLKKLFPNFHTLVINSSYLKTITKDDLKEYKDLKKIVMSGCPLIYLPGDLFDNFENIEHIELYSSDLNLIEPSILDGLNNLKHVDFERSESYSICYRTDPVCKCCATLEMVKAQLHDRLIERFKPIQELSNSEQKLKEQVKQLQESETSLKQQVCQLKVFNVTYVKENEQQKQSIDSLKKQLASLETRIENYKAENKQLRTFGERQKHEAKESKSDKAKAIKEVQILKEVQSKLSQQVQKLKNSEAKLNSENIQLKTSKSRIEKQLQESKSSEKQLNLQIEHLKTAEKNLSARNQQLEKLKASLGYDLASFTKNESTKDFKIIIGSQEFLVHKFLLAARSPTLAQVLKNNPEVENLNLVDIPVDIFEVILKFLYTDELPGDDGTNFLSLFAAAGKLKIQKLVEHAAENLIEHVDSANALTILPLSVSFKLHDLKVKAFKILKDKYSDVKFEDEWLDNPEKMIKVVAMLKRKEEILKQFDEEFKEVVAIV